VQTEKVEKHMPFFLHHDKKPYVRIFYLRKGFRIRMYLAGVGEFPSQKYLCWELADIVQHGKACEQAQRTI
jgi:hypothetical protein